MKIKVTSLTFDDECRINESNVRLNDTVEEKGKWPCNLILRTAARKWIYERYSDMEVCKKQSFVCRSCSADRQITVGFSTDLKVDIGNGYRWKMQTNSVT